MKFKKICFQHNLVNYTVEIIINLILNKTKNTGGSFLRMMMFPMDGIKLK